MSAKTTKQEIDALAHSIAYESAVVFLDCNCMDVPAEIAGGEAGWRRAVGPWSEDEQKQLDDSMRYLEMRGLIDHHPANSNFFLVLDESEATA